MNLQLQQGQSMQSRRPLLKLLKAGSSAWRSAASLQTLSRPETSAGYSRACHLGKSSHISQRCSCSGQRQTFQCGLQHPLSSSCRSVTTAASTDNAETDPELERAIQEAEQASEASESTAPRAMNPDPLHPGDVLPETVLLEGEDHTSAFVEKTLGAVRQGANVGAIAEDQPGVSEPAAGSQPGPSAGSETNADLEGDPALDAASAQFLEEADLPLKGAPPMDRLSDPGLIDLWLRQRRQYIQQLWNSNFFNFSDNAPTAAPLGNWTSTGHLKRADMAVGRQRPDLMFSLPQDLVREYAQLRPLFSDKKIASSYKRMEATYVEGEDAGKATGGPAQTRDLLRYLYSIDVAMSRTANMTKKHPSVEDVSTIESQMRLGAQIVPLLCALLEKEPEPSSMKAAAAAKKAHEEYSDSSNKKEKEPHSRRSLAQEVSPGDWMCPQCNAHNFGRRSECLKCSAPRPEGLPPIVAQRMQKDPAPGDWACPECGFKSNFARRSSCFQCNARKPAGLTPQSGLKPGDWECGDCGEVNFARRTECFGCGAPASAASKREPRASRETRTPSPMEMRPGDWLCPDCRAHNFATKTECFKCGVPRPASAGPPKPDARARPGFAGDRGMGPGDWSCPSCNAHNFARRTECFSCSQPRPVEVAGAGAGRGPPPRQMSAEEGAQWWDEPGSGARSGSRGRSNSPSPRNSRGYRTAAGNDRPRSIPSAGGSPSGRDDFW